jgi:hypothetical protein
VGGQIKKNEMGGACSMEDEKCIQCFVGEKWIIEGNLENLDVDGKMVLNKIFTK